MWRKVLILYKIKRFLFGSNLLRAIKNQDSILNRFLDWCSSKFSDFIIIPFETLERIIYWGWKLRNNHDWDYGFVYEILYLKLKRMYKCFSIYGMSLWMKNENSKETRKLKIAIELCKRLMNDDFRHKDIKKYYKNYFFLLLNKHLDSWWD